MTQVESPAYSDKSGVLDPLPLLGKPQLAPDEFPASAKDEPDGVFPLLRQIWDGFKDRDSWTPASVFRLSWVFALATASSWLGIMLSHQSEGVATIWLSNGLVLGLLITQPRSRWLAYFLAGLCADTVADMLIGDPFRLAFGVSLANSIEVVSSCLLLTLLLKSPLDLSRRRSLIGFLLISVVGATAITSALGAWWTLVLLPGEPWLQMFRKWYLGDMLGMAILAPLVIMAQRPAFLSMFERRQLMRTLSVFAYSMLVTVFVFTVSSDPLIFLMFPTFLLVAFRLGLPGTVVNIFLFTLMAIGFTVKGHGPLMLISGEHMMQHRIVIAQIFAAVAIFTMFPVAAVLEEKEALKRSLLASELRFRDLAYVDDLTGLPNRRAFNRELHGAWEAAESHDRELALIILDADLFKQYNDSAGHLAGDECLRQIARVAALVAKSAHGMAARIGGEEFAVILPGKAAGRARTVGEDIRIAVADLALPHPFTSTGVQTVSLGIAIRVPLPDQQPIELVKLADQALYAAKFAGRNQVSVA